MPIATEQIEFFITNITAADYHTISSAVSQLFSYLEVEANRNGEYIRYEKEREKWLNWPKNNNGGNRSEWALPTEYNDAKSLSYYLYKIIAERSDGAIAFMYELFRARNLNENIHKFNSVFLQYFIKALEDILNSQIPQEDAGLRIDNIIGDKIFIIHGHDDKLKTEVQLLLSRADIDDIVLHECPDKGRTIIDKLIEESNAACYVIALMSPDDILANGNARARQNVILEIGYFLGRLGKERVRLLKQDNVEIPSDLEGILYEQYDVNGNWRMKLLKEISAVGISVNFDKVISKY